MFGTKTHDFHIDVVSTLVVGHDDVGQKVQGTDIAIRKRVPDLLKGMAVIV